MQNSLLTVQKRSPSLVISIDTVLKDLMYIFSFILLIFEQNKFMFTLNNSEIKHPVLSLYPDFGILQVSIHRVFFFSKHILYRLFCGSQQTIFNIKTVRLELENKLHCFIILNIWIQQVGVLNQPRFTFISGTQSSVGSRIFRIFVFLYHIYKSVTVS